MTQITLGTKEVRDKFVSQDNVKEALLGNKEVLDSYNSATGSLDEYDVVDNFRKYSCIEAYRVGEHTLRRFFKLKWKRGELMVNLILLR